MECVREVSLNSQYIFSDLSEKCYLQLLGQSVAIIASCCGYECVESSKLAAITIFCAANFINCVPQVSFGLSHISCQM